jgi:hypothetical protein
VTQLRIDFRAEVWLFATNPDLAQENNAEIATQITGRQYLDLPLEQAGRIRSPTSFVYLAAGVQGDLELNGAEYTGATNVIAANGSNIWNTELLVDGFRRSTNAPIMRLQPGSLANGWSLRCHY